MIAFKWLLAGQVAPFTSFVWPSGEWVAQVGPGKGIHACHIANLPLWIAEELWRIELDGAVVEHSELIEAERGRLIERIEAWRPALFAEACAARAQVLLAEAAPEIRAFADDISNCAKYGLAGAAGFITAKAAAAAAHDENAYLAERAWQAQWLARELSL